MSHTGGTAAIVIARNRRVGVDVEKIGRNLKPLELATQFFSPQECKWLRSQPASEQLAAFFSCWTAKESYIKAVGEGLAMRLSGFAIIPKIGNARLRLEVYGQPEESKKWLVWQLELKAGTCAAITAESDEVTIRTGEWFPSC
jgi:4'-phosphopantetheinyl transferase